MVIDKQRRMTPQRMKVLEFLRKVKTHPTAEMVYDGVVKDMPTITLATVYRNLNLLAEQGDVLKLEINNEFRFDGDTCYHQHCVCKICGKIHDVFQENLSSYALRNIRAKGFRPDCVSIIFYGACKGCHKITG
ncbi:Fur family transcriptional regulator [Thermoproteota archaeon]